MDIRKSFFIIFFGVLVSANTITFDIRDLNTKVGINNVSINLRNSTDEISGYTVDGLKSFTENTDLLYYDLKKIGYFSISNVSMGNVTGDSYNIVFMTPISTDGLIRVPVGDLTGGEHEYCVYYSENNRLDTCYKLNETAIFITNKEYIIRPKITSLDTVSSLTVLNNFGGYYVKFLFGFILMFSIFLFFLALLIYLYKRVRLK